MDNTIKFIKQYIAENRDGFKDGVEYVENRGWIDGFGIEAILEGAAKQEFARRFGDILEANDELREHDEKELIDILYKGVQGTLVRTNLFNSTSMGSNALDLYTVREAQHLIERLDWYIAADEV